MSVWCQHYSTRCPLPLLFLLTIVKSGKEVVEAIAKRPPQKNACCPLWVSAWWHNFTEIWLRNPPHPAHQHHKHQYPTFDFTCESFNSSPLLLLTLFSPWQPPGFFSEKMVLGLRFNWNNICCTPLPPQLYSPLTTGIIFSLCAEFCHFLLQGSLCFWPQAGSNTPSHHSSHNQAQRVLGELSMLSHNIHRIDKPKDTWAAFNLWRTPKIVLSNSETNQPFSQQTNTVFITSF